MWKFFFLNFCRLLKDFRKIKYAMPCNASYARLLFLYARQFDMQPMCTPMLAIFFSKSGCYTGVLME
jgi:hypothetical protein